MAKNGKSRKINNYKQYRYVLYTQKSRLDREELEIISIVYQVQIRIFREGNSCKESNVTCIDQVGYNYGRVVNLLIRRGEWALLQNELKGEEGEKENITGEKETQNREEGVERGDRVESKQEDRTQVGTIARYKDKREREARRKDSIKRGELGEMGGNEISIGKNGQEQVRIGRERIGEEGNNNTQPLDKTERGEGEGKEYEERIIYTRGKTMQERDKFNHVAKETKQERGYKRDRRYITDKGKRGDIAEIEQLMGEQSKPRDNGVEYRDKVGRGKLKENSRGERGKSEEDSSEDDVYARSNNEESETSVVKLLDKSNMEKWLRQIMESQSIEIKDQRGIKIGNSIQDTLSQGKKAAETVNEKYVEVGDGIEGKDRIVAEKEAYGKGETSINIKVTERRGEPNTISNRREKGKKTQTNKRKGRKEEGEKEGVEAQGVQRQQREECSIDAQKGEERDRARCRGKREGRKIRDKERIKGKRIGEKGESEAIERKSRQMEIGEIEQSRAQEGKVDCNREIDNLIHRDRNMGAIRRGESVVTSEISSRELIDREMLEECLDHNNKTRGGREDGKSKHSRSEKTQKEEEELDMEIENLGDADHNKEARIRGGSTPRSESSSIELIDREKLEACLEQKKKPVGVRQEEREDINRIDRDRNGGVTKRGESVANSEISSIELIDREKLEECLAHNNKLGGEREDEKSEDSKSDKTQQGEEGSDREIDNLGDTNNNKGARKRGGSTPRSESISIELIDRKKLEECLERKDKSVGGGGDDREDSRRDKAQKDKQEANREIENLVDRDSNRGGRIRGGSVVSSESRIIELIDREKLEKCLEQYIKAGGGKEDETRVVSKREKAQKEKEVLNTELDNLGDRNSNMGVGVRGGSVATLDSSSIELIDREKLEECLEQESRTGEERKDEEREDIKSEKTTSSIEALFRDRQVEEEGKRLGNKGITRRKVWERWKGESEANSEISSIELINREELEECLVHNDKTGGEREDEKSEDSESEKTQQEEEDSDREIDNLGDIDNNKGARRRGGSIPRSESSSIELIDRKKLEECLEQKDKSVGGGEEDREDGRRDKAQKDKQETNREIENLVDRDSNRGGRIKGGSVGRSESSITEPIDREKLDKCLEQYTKAGGGREDERRVSSEREKTQKEKEVLNTELDNRVDRNSNRGAGVRGGSVATLDSSSIELIDREKLEECLEQESRTGEEREDEEREDIKSEKTTSSIEALFRDRQLEKEGKRLGNKGITRRKVWERWKGVVRGMIRRSIKKKKKIEREIEKEKEANRLVFDYTTYKLSAEEMQLLGRGEAFCVVDHKIHEDRSKVDIYNFQRRLRLHELFRDPGSKEEEERVEVTCTPARRSTYRIGETVDSGLRIGRGGSRDGAIGIERRGGGGNTRGSIRGRERGSGRVSRMSTNRVRSETYRAEEERRRESENRVATTDRRGGRRSSIVRGSVRRRESRRSINIGQSEVGREEEGGGNVEYKEKGRRLPSIYNPDSQNRNLNRYNTCIQEEIMLSIEKKVEFRDNISKAERKALKLLKSRIEEKEIIITRADKGSGLVAVDYDRYINKGTKYIEEEAGAYTRVQETEKDIIDRLSKQRNKIAELLKERGVIPVQTATYIKKQLEQKITGIKFYYKIHKDRNIDTMPLRPLQSCIKAPTQHLSIVLTDILQTLLTDKNIPSFIFDSNQLLYRLRNLGNIPDSCTIVSSDVSALYPSIPHREGFRAIKGFLEEKTSYNMGQIESIIIALELVITENFMIWNKQIYKQTSGVAMGTPVAVAYANIFMNWVDKEVRQGAPYIYEHIRFIDDNLFILPEDRVESLIETANNVLPPYIKFTYEKLDKESEKGLPFLDTQLFISKEKTIESRLYTKKTDRHAYLLPSSYHPPHITKNIPMAVFGRIRKICSREEWYREDAKLAEGWLANRGYERKEIQRAVEKTSRKDRWKMIEQIEKNRDKSLQKEEGEVVQIPFIMTFNQHGREIKKILKDRQPLLDSAFRRTKVRPRLSYRRRRSLNDVVVQKGLRGPLEDNRKELNIFSECGEKPGYRNRCPCKGKHSQEKCRCCMHNRGKIEGVECNIHKPVNCNSKNIVYMIGCRECNKKYIGETQQRLKDRLAQHMYNVDKLNQPVYLYFRYVHKLENLYIGVVETVRGEEPFMRKVREAWWINHLKTLEPSGFNVKLECNQIYEATS